MILGVGVLILLILIWIGLSAAKVCQQAIVAHAYCDSLHPVYPRASIVSSVEQVRVREKNYAKACKALNANVEYVGNTAPGAPRSYSPSPAVKVLIRAVCSCDALWEFEVRCHHLMIESNLMVRRGEVTIAEAGKMMAELNARFPLVPQIDEKLADWLAYLSDKDHWQQKTSMGPGDAVWETLANWQARFERSKEYLPHHERY